ncbi:ATP-binding protein [Vibrio sp. 10N.261.46.E12]|uniref:PAS domain-containing hybrid sensor histidine kinase/response regulator n=1 Tax=unclassified Vibrio TaxID=2614977 RepID=UPI0009768E0F|nr:MULTISPECIES: ATP-binding protein [unclassified Vibrio]PMN27818.1 hybrid sensor histidine kinase/response regulator [Vibrio sp. 10N.261.45.E2]PMN57496.1 hybrid sensor histidine kinase/response regulator [Vibrio sp. 10N.261.45.E11]PMN76434.1 hybrid sensor histidine kinase/response regulator [Vibrio sp. 10N.261.45.A6]OMO32081.1 hybrid sensor histidine kinase/response regulator [Vibrio sp. 10N.261.45.E1]PMJ36789.1 hybrid sensor histidine kinase/response regulator [Vibrio sp. 10N.286.45.B6]
MTKLSSISPRVLLVFFLLLTSLTYGGISLYVLSSHSQSTVKQLQSGNSSFELESAKIFMEKYLEVAEDRIILASQYQEVIDAASGSNIERLSFNLERFKGQNQSMQFAVRDRTGQLLFEDTFRHPASKQEQAIFDAIANQEVDDRILYLLHDDTNHICIKLFMPLLQGSDFVGVLYGETAVDYDEFFGSFVTNRERWYELSQVSSPIASLIETDDTHTHSHSHDSHTPFKNKYTEEDWILTQTALTRGDLVLTQGVSSSFVNDQLLSLQKELLNGLLIVLALSSILVFFIGQKLFVNPHKELAGSKKQLEESNERLAEQERESHLLATVVKTARDGVVITDNKGRIEWVNRAFERMTGYRLDSIKGLRPGSFLQGEGTSVSTASRIGSAIRQGNQVKAEILNYAIDKTPYWIDIDIVPLRNIEGEVERFIAIERDITEFKKLEKELEEQANNARQANDAKSLFLATMSHEIRTPMNGLLGILQMLVEDLEKAEQREVLQLALDSGEHLIAILNDILDLAKIENDSLEIDPHSFKMYDITNPVLNTYQTLCSEKGIEFSLLNDCDASCSYKGDSVRIRQVILNLVGNALKFTKYGSINVTIKPLGNSLIEFAVEDSGIGIPSERLNSIFNEFEQADVSTTRNYGGTGLGLAISHKLVTLMKGQLNVKSELGIGSRFSFVINLPAVAVEHQKSPTKQEVDLTPFRVLVTDDNKMNRIIANGFLDKLNVECVTCDNGYDTLTHLETGHFNLAIIDNHMPKMNGLETVRKIRQAGHVDLVIFGWTADIMQTSTQAFIEAGANEVLTKPLIKSDLVEALSRYLKKIKKVDRAS